MTEAKTYYAMVISRCTVAGEQTESLNVSAHMVLAASESEVRTKLETESAHSYKNSKGETVEWQLVKIMAIDECTRLESGDEVTGFIFGRSEFDELF